MNSNFRAYGDDGTLVAVTAASAAVALPSDAVSKAAPSVAIFNRGTVDAYVKLGGASVAATTLSMLVRAGSVVTFQRGSGNTHLAAITLSGGTELVVWLGEGELEQPPTTLQANIGNLAPGQNQNADRQDAFVGGAAVAISATGAVKVLPCGLVRLRCITAGTITSLHDNASAATGDQVLGSTTMTAGQVIEIGEYLANGLWAVVASGTFRAVFTPTF